ncbi:MAG: hypothetical protein R2795_02660 [Saprospiraceae bacterium]
MNIASLVELSLLKPDAARAQVHQVCEQAQQQQYAAVSLPPYFVAEARQLLGNASPVKLTTVIGFPMGYAATVAKVEEIKRGIDEGAEEFDVVVNLSAVKAANWNFVQNDLDRMITACHLRAKQIEAAENYQRMMPDTLSFIKRF